MSLKIVFRAFHFIDLAQAALNIVFSDARQKGSLLFLVTFLQLSSFSSNTAHGDVKNQASEWIKNTNQLGFQENKGQVKGRNGRPLSDVFFKAEAPGLNIWLTKTGLTYQFFSLEKKLLTNADGSPKIGRGGAQEKEKTFQWKRVDMVLEGASIKKENILPEGNITQGRVNYFLGHCPNGIFDVQTYTRVTFKEVYPSIDWVVYTSPKGTIKYDFIVHPGADPKQIRLIYEGNGDIQIAKDQLQFSTELGQISEGKLLCYQGNQTNWITSKYLAKKRSTPSYLGVGNAFISDAKKKVNLRNMESLFSYEVTLELGNYDTTKDLVVDPALVWGTTYGGSDFDGFMSMETDSKDNLYICGYTRSLSTEFPTQDGGTFFQGENAGFDDVILIKFDNNGVLLWSTFYGGSAMENAMSIAIDAFDNVLVSGYTGSKDFPIQNALVDTVTGLNDAFVLKFDDVGNRLWATYYGGSGTEYWCFLTVDLLGNVWVTGETSSDDLPVQPLAGAYNQATNGGGFENFDAFMLKLDAAGNQLWSTYYGGNGNDKPYAITADLLGNVWVTGYTASTDFPITGATAFQTTNAGTEDAFILKFGPGRDIVWGSYFGGDGLDAGKSIASDPSGNAWVLGRTLSTNLSTTPTALQTTYGGEGDVFILKLGNDGTKKWATYYGGSGDEAYLDWISSYDNLVVDNCNNVCFSFETTSADITTLNPGSCHYFDGTYSTNEFENVPNIFLAQIDSVGVLQWATHVGSSEREFRSPIAIDSDNNLFMGGEFVGYNEASTLPMKDPGGGVYFDSIMDWSDDGFILKFITPEISETAQLNPTTCDPCGGFARVSVPCGIPPFSYVWSNGTQLINTTETSSTITGLCAGNYSVTVTSQCTTEVIDFSLTSVDQLDATITPVGPFCEKDSAITLQRVDPGGKWSGNGITMDTITGIFDPVVATPGNHEIIYTIPGACGDTDTINIVVNAIDDATFGYGLSDKCRNHANPVVEFVETSGGTFKIDNNGTIDPSTGEIDLLSTDTGSYVVTYITNGLCPDSSSVTVKVVLCVEADFVSDSVICAGQCVSFRDESYFGPFIDTSSYNWQWTFNGGQPSSSDVRHPSGICFLEAGTHSVKLIIDGPLGTDSISKDILVNPGPVLTMDNVTPISIFPGNSVTLTVTTSGVTYLWSPSEGLSCTDCASTIASPEEDRAYAITIEDSNQCVTTDNISILLIKDFSLFLPNSFSPNGDDLNETFTPKGIGISKENYSFTIANRWGDILFETEDLTAGWDGTYKGQKVANGTYVWQVDYIDDNQKSHSKTGQVHVIR